MPRLHSAIVSLITTAAQPQQQTPQSQQSPTTPEKYALNERYSFNAAARSARASSHHVTALPLPLAMQSPEQRCRVQKPVAAYSVKVQLQSPAGAFLPTYNVTRDHCEFGKLYFALQSHAAYASQQQRQPVSVPHFPWSLQPLELSAYNSASVERTTSELSEWLQSLCTHPFLSRSAILRQFLSSPFEDALQIEYEEDHMQRSFFTNDAGANGEFEEDAFGFDSSAAGAAAATDEPEEEEEEVQFECEGVAGNAASDLVSEETLAGEECEEVTLDAGWLNDPDAQADENGTSRFDASEDVMMPSSTPPSLPPPFARPCPASSRACPAAVDVRSAQSVSSAAPPSAVNAVQAQCVIASVLTSGLRSL